MGKKKDKAAKKDKASKSKKKHHDPESVADAAYGDNGPAAPEPENIQVAEYVTVGEMMDLINTLNQELEQRARANEQLQQQITRNQNSVRRQYNVLRVITIILLVGVITIGYNTVKTSSRISDHVDTISADISRMTSQMQIMNTSMQSVNSDISRLNTGLHTMSTDITAINQSIDKLESDVKTINAGTVYKPNETRYRGYPTDPRSPWR